MCSIRLLFSLISKEKNMNKLFGYGLLAATLAAPLHASAADINWVQWSGTTGTVSQNGVDIDVAFDGASIGTTASNYYSGYPGAYVSAEVGNGPGTNGTLTFSGGNAAVVHHIAFSSAVVDPYIAFVSLGSSSTLASIDFVNADSIDLISSGAGPWGNGTATLAGNVLTGYEGNGVLRLNGTYTDLYFTTPNYEYWYGATVGIAAAVPEPGTWAMLLAGGALLGLVGRRREKFAPGVKFTA
jgi:hypothetical protein